MYKLKLRHYFDAAHLLYNYKGKCANLHGHRWEVLVEISVDTLDEQGMVVDFSKIKKIINQLDHCFINEHPYFVKVSPTAENIARFLHKEIVAQLNYQLSSSVTVWESPNASITYDSE